MLAGAQTPARPSLTAADLDPGPQGPYRFVGTLEMMDSGNFVVQPDGNRRLLDQQSEVVDRRTGGVYQRRDMPPNPEAARYASRPGIVGKALSAIGLPDYSGDRARTSWGEAAENTARGFSLANALRGGMVSADRMMSETATGRQDPLAAQQGAEIAGSIAATAAPTALAGGMPRNALTTFIGHVGANNLDTAGRPAARMALNMAHIYERRGLPEAQTRELVNKWVAENDPALGGVVRGPDNQWRVELDDSPSVLRRRRGTGVSTLAEEDPTPDLYLAYPDIGDVSLRRQPSTPGSGPYHTPRTGRPSEIGIVPTMIKSRNRATS